MRRRSLWGLAVLAVFSVAAYETRIQQEMADFAVYYTAAERALQLEPLYRNADGHYQFKYLPLFAWGTAPLALLEQETAKAIWFGLSVAMLVLFLRWSIRVLPQPRRTARVLYWLTVLLMAKFYAHELTLGQTNILLGTILAASLLAMRAGAPRTAGALIGTAVFVKPYALILLPWLAVSSGITAALTGCGLVVVGLALPASTYGWDGNLALLAGWVRTVTESTSGNLLGADNVSLAAMWAKWIGIGAPAAVLAGTAAAALLAMIGVTWRQRSRVNAPEYLEYALLMLAMPLLSPQGWDYVLLLGTPAVVCLVDRWPELTRAWKTASALALCLMGLTIFDLMGRTLYGRFMAVSGVTLAALGVAISLAHLRRRNLA